MPLQLSLPNPPPTPNIAVALALAANLAALAAALIGAAALHYQPPKPPYAFNTTTADLAAVALVAVLAATVALCSAPPAAVAIGVLASCLALIKLAIALPATSTVLQGGGLAAASGALAAAGCISVAASGYAIWRTRRRAAAADDDDDAGQLSLSSTRAGSLQAEKLLAADAREAAERVGVVVGAARDPTFRRLLGLARPELPMLVNATIALFFSSAAQMAMPALVGEMIGGVIGSSSSSVAERQKKLQTAVAQLGVIFIAGGTFSFIRGYLFTLAGERVVARMRRVLFSCLVVQDIGFFDSQATGELLNRLASDTTVIQGAVTINVSMGLRFGAQVVIGLVLIFFESWKLSLLMLSIVPPIVIVGVVYGRFMRKFSKRYQKALADASDVAQETFAGIRTVRSFANEVREGERYIACVDESYELGRKKAFAYGLFGSLIGTIGQFSVIGVLWYGGNLVLDNIDPSTGGALDPHGMTPAKLTSFLLYTVVIAGCLGGLSDLFGSLMNALGASTRVFHLLDSSPSVALTGGARPAEVRGRIQLQDVEFSYPARPDQQILRGVSVTVEPGTVLALCGPSGSGKSTVIGLLERWYEPTSGAIFIDGRRLDSLDPSWWRRQVALVAQEPVLFACSIRDNVAYGRPEASDAEVNEALRTANAHEFVAAMSDGTDTKVGERGVQLSGGQKQRIAIARALLVDPKVLLLDEATSALDSESEHVVQEAIDRLMAERTTVVIAHRLSTIRTADCIVVVSKGRIVERGTHEELIGLGGLYAQLTARQRGGDGEMGRTTSSSQMAPSTPMPGTES